MLLKGFELLQGEAKGQEALRASAADDKSAAMRRCATADLDLLEAQQRISSTATAQVSARLTNSSCTNHCVRPQPSN